MINPFLIELKKNYEMRRQKNGRYSLRAFSRDLKIEPSVLSKLLRGSRQFTDESILKIGTSMGLEAAKIRHYCLLNRDFLNSRKLSKERMLFSFKELPIEEYELISKWYYMSILEAIKLPELSRNPDLLAKTLGLSTEEVTEYLGRLVQFGYLAKDKKGKYTNQEVNVSSLGNQFTTAALRNLQKEFLAKSMQAVDTIPFEKRSHSFLVVNTDTKHLNKIIKKVHDFRREMNRFITRKSAAAQSVYCLQLSLFPLGSLEKE